MNDLQKDIKRLQDKLQHLLKNYNVLIKENDHLKAETISLKEKEQNYHEHIDRITQKVNILQAASGQATDIDKKQFEKHINQYIREIDKCIGLLSE